MNVAARTKIAMGLLQNGLLKPRDKLVDKVLKAVTPTLYRRRVAAAEKRALMVLLLGR